MTMSLLLLGGCSGSDGTQGPAGPVGPSMPVIQSLWATGLPAAPGGSVTVGVDAQSADDSALVYAWSVSDGFELVSGSGTEQLTLTPVWFVSGRVEVTVSDGQGGAATGAVSVSARDGNWGWAGTIESSVNHAYAPQVAMDGGGNGLAVWMQHDGTADSIYASRFE